MFIFQQDEDLLHTKFFNKLMLFRIKDLIPILDSIRDQNFCALYILNASRDQNLICFPEKDDSSFFSETFSEIFYRTKSKIRIILKTWIRIEMDVETDAKKEIRMKRIRNEMKLYRAQMRSFAAEIRGLDDGPPSSLANQLVDTKNKIFVFPKRGQESGHVLTVGPEGTPYAGGLFLFNYKYLAGFPEFPLSLKLRTTGRDKKVSFGRYLRADGKVLHSVLHDPKDKDWPSKWGFDTLETVIDQIEDVLTEDPLNAKEDPSEVQARRKSLSPDAAAYAEVIRYYTLLVAVCEQGELVLKNQARNTSPYLDVKSRDMIKFLFLKNFGFYRDMVVTKQADPKVNGQTMTDHYGIGKPKVVLDYDDLLCRLDTIRDGLMAYEVAKGSPLVGRIKKSFK